MMLMSYSLTGFKFFLHHLHRYYFTFFIYSRVGHIVPPLNLIHFYSATKFAITAIAEGVRQELREMKSNCRCTVSINALDYI